MVGCTVTNGVLALPGLIAPAMRDALYFDKQNPTFSIFVDAVK
jgi:hypothetical protein